MLDFIKTVTSFFQISRTHTRIGLVLFSSRPIPIFNFRRFSSRSAVQRAVDRVRYPRGGTKTGLALDFTRKYLFGGRYGRTRKRVLVLLTDGISQDNVQGPARVLKSSGVEVFAVGLGKKFRRRELEQIATDKSHVFKVSFGLLLTLVAKMKKTICSPYVPISK